MVNQFSINFTVAENLVQKNKHSDALALLYNTVPISKFQKRYYCNIMAVCHLAVKNFNAAIIEVEKFIAMMPDSAFPYYLLGEVYKKKEIMTKRIYIIKSLYGLNLTISMHFLVILHHFY
ncbi:MAG: hypothetical protein HY738_23055 [Bacteroidia bacterium]|nr:hypothetical protein [Bacteroidia bacterium]